MHINTEELENRIEYKFKNIELLYLSLTHPSYANENRIDKVHTNQRLEFLGDAVLELISSDFLYNNYTDYSEGQLTKTRAKLVCEENLANVGRNLKLNEYLLIGNGENSKNLLSNDSVMCDTVEAIIGAIYKDGGLDYAISFVNKFIFTYENLNKSSHDYKSILQEKVNSFDRQLCYKVVNESGPDHNKIFEVEALIDDKVYGKGKGKSKKDAEQNAAKEALKHFEE